MLRGAKMNDNRYIEILLGQIDNNLHRRKKVCLADKIGAAIVNVFSILFLLFVVYAFVR